MIEEIGKIKSGGKELKEFGIAAGIFLSALITLRLIFVQSHSVFIFILTLIGALLAAHILTSITIKSKTGLFLGIALILAGAYTAQKNIQSASLIYIASGALISLGAAYPSALKPIHKVFMTAAVIIGWIVSSLILTVLFYLVITPISTLARIIGKKFLDKKIHPEAKSYWIPKDTSKADKSGYEKQF